MSITSPPPDQGLADKTLAAQRRRERLHSFVQCMSEIAPLIEHVSEDDPDLVRERLKEMLERHLVTLTRISEAWGISATELRGAYFTRKLSRVLAELLAHQEEYEIPFDSFDSTLEAIASSIESYVSQSESLIALVSDHNLSNDALVNVRLSLLGPSLEFESRLRALGANAEKIDSTVEWLHWAALNLSKDLAFHWDSSSEFRDRESLLTNSIQHCATLVMRAWDDALVSNADELDSIIDDEWLPKHGRDLLDALFEMDMGYMSHSELTQEWLVSQMLRLLNESVDRISYGDIPPRLAVCIRNSSAVQLQKMAADVWLKEARALLKHIDEMSQEEFDAYSASDEGKKPMSFTRVERAFWARFERWEGLVSTISLDEDAILAAAKSRLAILWGSASAFSRIKSGQS